MRNPPCPSYDVPSRAELRREEMDEAKAEAEQEGYDRGHDDGYRRAWKEAMDAIVVAMREMLAEPTGGYEYQRAIPRDVCRGILERLDAGYCDVPPTSVLNEEVEP